MIYGSGERIESEFSGLNEFLILKPGSKILGKQEALTFFRNNFGN